MQEKLKEVFGTCAEVGRILNIPASAVYTWRTKVPEKHHKKLIAEAKKIGYELTVKELRGHK